MVYLINLTGCKTNLVAVRTVSVCRRGNNFSLRKLARQCFLHRFKRISCPCNSHCGINIRPARKRVSYSSAYAGRRAAERLNFCRMVVCFVFEKQQPVLIFSFYIHLYFYRTGIYFFRLIKLTKLSVFFKIFYGNCRNIHKIHGLCTT